MMRQINIPRPHARDWLNQMFHCRAAQSGGVIRRQIVDVEREVGTASFLDAVRDRGFRVIKTRHHFVVVCDDGPIEILR